MAFQSLPHFSYRSGFNIINLNNCMGITHGNGAKKCLLCVNSKGINKRFLLCQQRNIDGIMLGYPHINRYQTIVIKTQQQLT